jgi:hypothetical protein
VGCTGSTERSLQQPSNIIAQNEARIGAVQLVKPGLAIAVEKLRRCQMETPRPTEDQFTKTIESYTAAIPSTAISLWLLERWRSLMCQVTGQGKWGNFIAQWVPTWLIIGLYNKLVKLEGHDRYQRGRHDDWERIAAKEANAGLSA